MYQNQINDSGDILSLETLIHKIHNGDASVSIHNCGRSFSSYFEMQVPYLILYESVNPNTGTLTYIDASAGKYQVKTTPLSILPEYKNPPLHKHNYFEIMFVLSGEVQHRIENKSHIYRTGDCCVMNKNIRHTEMFNTAYEVLYLELSQDFAAELIKHDVQILPGGNTRSYSNSIYYLIKQQEMERTVKAKEYLDFLVNGKHEIPAQILENLNQQTEVLIHQKPGCIFILQSLIAQLFASMDDPSLYNRNFYNVLGSAEESLYCQVLYLLEEYKGQLTRKELNEKLNYSPDYLNRVFKKFSGVSIKQYCQKYSMKEIEKLLATTNLGITEILTLAGINNRSYFYTLFYEKHHMTPKEYRTKHKILNAE